MLKVQGGTLGRRPPTAGSAWWGRWRRWLGQPWWAQLLVITRAGLLGNFVDSCLGATVQALYTCPACEKETERHPRHSYGTATVFKRGLPWLNNDWVNTACTLRAGLLGVLLGVLV